MMIGPSKLSHVAHSMILSAAVAMNAVACDSSANSDVEKKYEQYCSACHATGAAGAPRKGDATSWEPRLAKGEQALVKSVREGIVGMPAMGLCQECTDEDFAALIEHMSP